MTGHAKSYPSIVCVAVKNWGSKRQILCDAGCNRVTLKRRHGLHAVQKHYVHRAPFSQQLAECNAWCAKSPPSLTGQTVRTAHVHGSTIRSIFFVAWALPCFIIARDAATPFHFPYLACCELSHSCKLKPVHRLKTLDVCQASVGKSSLDASSPVCWRVSIAANAE